MDLVGSLSANTRTNILALYVGGNIAAAGTNYVTASWNGCSATATAVVVHVSSLTASTNPLCGGGQVIYTAQSNPSGFENYLIWSGEGLLGTGPSRTNNYGTPGLKIVSVTCGSSVVSNTVTVHKVDITNTTQYGLAGSTIPVNYYLSSDSVGPFSWSVSPSGPAVNGNGATASVLPGNNAGTFTIKASASPLPSCNDTSTLQVVQVTFSPSALALCEGGTSNVTVTVNPASALSLLTFDTVTNTSVGAWNTHAHLAVNGTNLTVYGDVAGTAYLRVRLGATTIFGPTIQIVRVTFPPEAWYVGVGKDVTNAVTIIPAGAAVTFDTASNSIATATAAGSGVKLTGVAPGTTQVRAKIGGGAVCSTKNVTAVRVKFATNSITLCNGNNTSVGVSIDPPGSPVTFSASNPNLLQLAVQGTNITITPTSNGTAIVNAKVGNAVVDSLVVWSLTVIFPTNDWFAPRGGSQFFRVLVEPPFFASKVSFASSDPLVGTVSVSGVPRRVAILGVTNCSRRRGSARDVPRRVAILGVTNGSAQVVAMVGNGQTCGSKAFTVFRFDNLRFQKVSMAGAWKNIDQFYKFLGVFSGQTVTFGIVTTPSGITLPNDAVVWSTAASGIGPQTSVFFPKAGTAQIIASIGTISKSTSAEVIDRPSGIGENTYAALYPVYTAIAIDRNLLGTTAATLEPFVWASAAYPGVQHNTIADAARHAYWTCLLTRYTTAGYAEGITTAHEVAPGPSTETVMDLHNNAMGIALASHTHGTNNACCQTAVTGAVNSGLLWYLDASYGTVDTPEGTLLQPSNR